MQFTEGPQKPNSNNNIKNPGCIIIIHNYNQSWFGNSRKTMKKIQYRQYWCREFPHMRFSDDLVQTMDDNYMIWEATILSRSSDLKVTKRLSIRFNIENLR